MRQQLTEEEIVFLKGVAQTASWNRKLMIGFPLLGRMIHWLVYCHERMAKLEKTIDRQHEEIRKQDAEISDLQDYKDLHKMESMFKVD